MQVEQLTTPRVDEREWVRLQEELAHLFKGQLKMSRWQYVDTLPQYTPQPTEYQGRFDSVVLVQPPVPDKGLSLQRILEIVGLPYNQNVLKMTDWLDGKGKFRTPAVPYATWLDDGSRHLGVSPADVRKNLAEGERAGTGLDGTFLYVADRGVVRRHYLDLPGSKVSSGSAPYLGLWDGGPGLGCRWVGDVCPGYGSVVAGEKIVTK